MKLDLRVHTFHSGNTTIRPLDRIMRESCNSPEGVYRCARARGMDLVTITDHDQFSGALTIADRPDVIVGCEVTGVFPNDKVAVHLGVLGINEPQHQEIQRLRREMRELLPYLKQERNFTTLNHVASRINGPITASHTRRGIGRTWVAAPAATHREEFLAELHAGRVRVAGRQGNFFTMASDMLRLAAGFYEDLFRQLVRKPWCWKRQAFIAGGLVALPLVSIPLLAAMAHFILEDRFNRALLFDPVARPTAPRVPEVA